MALACLDEKQALDQLAFKPGTCHQSDIIDQSGNGYGHYDALLHGKVAENTIRAFTFGGESCFIHIMFRLSCFLLGVFSMVDATTIWVGCQ